MKPHEQRQFAVRFGFLAAIAAVGLACSFLIDHHQLWNGGLLISLGVVFVPTTIGAICFICYAPLFARKLSVEPEAPGMFRVFGWTFAIWGGGFALLCGGGFGFLHALVCAFVLHHIFMRFHLTAAPLVCLIPAWFVAQPVSDYGYRIGITSAPTITWMTAAVVAWNACMFAWFIFTLKYGRVYAAGLCKVCGYSLAGLTTNTCPECGEPISPPSSRPSAQRSAP